ncbi:trigger factor [Aureivirga sp. CE67]|uniref:trigger factor n=1 Tax=Aureivirga sp. CE67 TaxID=1788983 RepID=UPI0018CB9D6D|nr:trigger factor [Aureivirga sp. CE67]
MNITKENVDALNAVVKVDITAADYQDKVTKVLQDYRKQANIPGFRPGQVPMGLVKKQYGKSVMIDEVNKLLQEALNKFITEEKLDILGNPLPKENENFSWDAEDFSFEFELGLSPEFDVNLDAGDKVTYYNISADEELINKEIENIRGRFGKMISQEEVIEGATIVGTFVSEDGEIENKATFVLEDIKGKMNNKKFMGKKVGAELKLKTKNLFEKVEVLAAAMGKDEEEAKALEVNLTFTIEEINTQELAEVNQELFDKLFGEGNVTSEDELKAKIKEDAEKQFVGQADQTFLNKLTEYLVENTSFELPAEFLKKWLAVAGEKQLTAEEAEEQYANSEKGLRYQLIEGKIMRDNNIQLSYEDLKEHTKGFIIQQLAQFGNTNPEDSEVDEIANKVLSNQEEAKRISEQLVAQKVLEFFKENAKYATKEVNFEDFIKEVYNK